ncbi:MAG: 50S ribosomal protein L2 [Candidatus Pacearchaeota archaeon]
MGKRIIQQRRGKGGHVYRVKQKAFLVKVGYSNSQEGEWKVTKFVSSSGHSVPIAKVTNDHGQSFYTFATDNLYVGQKITFGGESTGDIVEIGNLKNGTEIFNIENKPKDGGKFIRSGGNYAIILGKDTRGVRVKMASKVERVFNPECRATIGRAAGGGVLDKPILKAGKKFHIMKAKSKLWPRTSAVKMNKIDHPFGSGRGKRIKSKIAKRNASPGKKVGLIRPRRTGRKKR